MGGAGSLGTKLACTVYSDACPPFPGIHWNNPSVPRTMAPKLVGAPGG